jgi:hypothetical protein
MALTPEQNQEIVMVYFLLQMKMVRATTIGKIRNGMGAMEKIFNRRKL